MVRQLLKKIARRMMGRKGPAPEASKPAAKPHSASAPASSGHGHGQHRAATQARGHGAGHHKPHHGGGAHPAHAPHAHSKSDHGDHPHPGQRPGRPSPEAPHQSLRHDAGQASDHLGQRKTVAPWSLDSFQVPPKEGFSRFHDFELPDEIMHAIADLGFQYCTPIQARVLEPAMAGRNVTGRAQTGTGKTAAFLVSVFTRFLRNPGKAARQIGAPRALVLAPTRELVIQIAQDAENLGKYTNLKCLAVYGGMDFDKQARMLAAGPVDLIAATPGRLLDFLRRGNIDLRHADALVIDEADRMLDMGFIPDVSAIVRRLPPKEQRQTLLFSATLTEDVCRLASKWMDDPVVAEVEAEQVATKNIKQLVYVVASRDKFTVLYNLLKQPGTVRTLVFGNRRDSTLELADALLRHGIKCGLLSGAIDQKKRLRILDEFKDGTLPVLVATDVAGRGLHIDDVSHVVNFDFPYEADDYVHRIGRTGRAGSLGTAISFACEDESFIIPEIEKYLGESLECRQPEEHLFAALPPEIPGMRAAARRERDEAGPGGYGGGSRSGGGRRPPPRGGGSRGGGRRR